MISVFETGNVYRYIGLSSDTKPTNATNGSLFLEMDTSKLFIYDLKNTQWRQFSGTVSISL